MPPPVVAYVGGVVIILGACYAVKEYVYEPYVAPALERWAAAFLASRERSRRHEPMAVFAYSDDDGEGKDADKQSKGKGRGWDGSERPRFEDSEQDRPPPIELEKMVEREKMAWAERDGLPLGLRKRPVSRPTSRPTSFVDLVEGPAPPAFAYAPLTPAPTNESGSPNMRLSDPLSLRSVNSAPLPNVPILPAPRTASIPVVRAATPVRSPTPLVPTGADEDETYHIVVRSQQPSTAPSSRAPSVVQSPSFSAVPSPYPSRPPSALSSTFSPARSNLSLPSVARTRSWTDVSQASGTLSDADVLSQSDRDVFGTDDEAGSEIGSVNPSEFGSEWRL